MGFSIFSAVGAEAGAVSPFSSREAQSSITIASGIAGFTSLTTAALVVFDSSISRAWLMYLSAPSSFGNRLKIRLPRRLQ